MRYRKLRIAWSTLWGLVAVLLCILWVRSYWRVDIVERRGNLNYSVGSAWGRMVLAKWWLTPGKYVEWHYESDSAEKIPRAQPSFLGFKLFRQPNGWEFLFPI